LLLNKFPLLFLLGLPLPLLLFSLGALLLLLGAFPLLFLLGLPLPLLLLLLGAFLPLN